MAEANRDDVVGTGENVRRVFEAMPVLMCALEGPEHRYIAANAAYRAFAPKVGIGKSLREVFPEAEGQQIFEMIDRVYRSGQPHTAREWRVFVDTDGSGVQERFLNMVGTPRRHADGTVEGVQFILDDVTDQVRARMAAEARATEMQERYEQARSSATVMQQALLAASVPVIPGADVAAQYLVATEDTAAGGDWFDALVAGERLVLVVGDVVGHGVRAAAVMAQLRTALRMQLLDGAGIGEALAAVNRFSASVPGASSATVCVGVFTPSTGVFDYCTAGHPPPLLLSADGQPRFAEPTGAAPLGSDRDFTVRTEQLDVGDVVLLYTDGLIERPGRPVVASTVEFAGVAASILAGGGFPTAATDRPVDRLCAQTLELLLRDTGYTDDVTMLGVQRTEPRPPLHLVVAADGDAEPVLRGRLREWLAHLGADATNALRVIHAAAEYVHNAVAHAYRGRDDSDRHTVTLTAALTEQGLLKVSVLDRGQWIPPDASRTSGRTHGLNLASMLVTSTRVLGDDQGTVAEFMVRLTRPARIVTDPQIEQRLPDQAKAADTFDVEVADDGTIMIIGDVDNRAAPALAGLLDRHSHAHTTTLVIDLSAVTHLGSAGIRALTEAGERAARHHNTLVLVAPPGGVAHHVLTLVGLPTSASHGQPTT